MCTPRLTLKEQKIFICEEMYTQKACAATSKDMHQWPGSTSWNPSSANWNFFTPMLSVSYIYIYIVRNSESPIIQRFYSFNLQASTMDCSQYWSFAHEYCIWNATVTGLQFWVADLKLHILSNAIDQVYTAFFYSDFTQQTWNLPEETLFGHFMTTLNNAFETELAQEDEGYESGTESFDIPIPLSRTPRSYHVSMVEDLSFDPTNFGQSPSTPEQHGDNSP